MTDILINQAIYIMANFISYPIIIILILMQDKKDSELFSYSAVILSILLVIFSILNDYNYLFVIPAIFMGVASIILIIFR